PIKCVQNILLMDYIGDASKVAPMLKDVLLRNPQKVFDELITFIRRMYQKNLVHADLSAFNILLFRQKPYVIDAGQAVLLDHPSSQEFLKRDIHNIVQHFKKYSVEGDEHAIYEALLKK
ncbi:MAG: serine protein kinase RIO, partial [Candidatus Thermoplasmatota archaeon]|nr:serine protein kinase RIO [Candidatus Thermoplasmatota archaeon]